MAGTFTFADFKKELLTGRIKPVYFISLYDNFLLDEAGKLLRREIFGSEEQRDNYFVKYGDEIKYDELLEMCSDLPSLFSSKKIIVLKRAEKLGRNLSYLLTYSQSPSPDTILLLGLDADYVVDNRLYSAAEVYNFCNLSYSEMEGWIRDEFARYGQSIGDNELGLFLASASSSPSAVKQEIDKIANYAGSESEISGEFILASLGYERSYSPDDLLTAVLNKESAKSIDILDALLNRSGVNEVYLLSLFAAFFLDLLIVKYAKRLDYSELFAKYRLWRKRVQFVENYRGKVGAGQFRRIIAELVTADRQIKTTMVEPKVIMTALVEKLLNIL